MPRKRKVKPDVLLPIEEVQIKCLQMIEDFTKKIEVGYPILNSCFGSINVSEQGLKSLYIRLSQNDKQYMVCFKLCDNVSGKKINFNKIYKKEDMKLDYLSELKEFLCFEFRD